MICICWLLIAALPAMALVHAGLTVKPVPGTREPVALRDMFPVETPEAREARRRRVAERRAGPAVIVHRGAAAFAPENTLAAYAAAMEHGADGCEVDVRRTRDGVFVLFHDDMLDRALDGFGTVSQLTYAELSSLRPVYAYGRPVGAERPQLFTELLLLARERAMLLHLDVKEEGLEEEVAAYLEAANVWEHVVAVNTATLSGLARHPRVAPLRYKAPGLYDGRRDVDPDAVRSALSRPGEMIIVDDPRVAARVLRRKAEATSTSRTAARPQSPARAASRPHPPAPSPNSGRGGDGGPLLVPLHHLRARFGAKPDLSVRELLAVIEAPFPEGGSPAEEGAAEGRRTERILERAWAAQRLGQQGRKTPEIVRALERLVRERSLHRDWMFHGLDGAMAARALGMLGATEAVPALVTAFRRVDPALVKVANPEYRQLPLSWTDFRTKMTILPALGDLRCPASKAFLKEYLAMDEAAARALGPLQWEDAARALLRQRLSRDEVAALLQSPNGAVRGTAILECRDHPAPARTAALKAVAPWALELTRARQDQSARLSRE